MKAIIATDAEYGIGRNNKLAWHIPADLRYFYQQTAHQIVIMGNNTIKSLPEPVRPLPNRHTLVVAEKFDEDTHGKCMGVLGKQEDFINAASLGEEAVAMGIDFPPIDHGGMDLQERVAELSNALLMTTAMVTSGLAELADDATPSPTEVWICGGASIYEQLLPYCDEVHWTRVPGTHDCDTHFNPADYMADDMKVVAVQELTDDEGNVVAEVEVWRAS